MQALTLSATEIAGWVGSFTWPFIRVAAMFSIAPALGSRLVPMRIRVVLSLLISLTAAPLITNVPAVDPLSANGLMITLQQLLIGLTMGFILQLVFSATMLAGEHIAMTMGLGFAQMTDPQNGVQVPVIGQFFNMFAILLFLALNGHLTLIKMILDSFSALPIASDGFGGAELWSLLEWAGTMFAGALLVALPAVITLLAVNVAMGLITRAAPQMNIFSVGFPVTLWLGFVILLIGLPAFLPVFNNLLNEGYTAIGTLMTGGN